MAIWPCYSLSILIKVLRKIKYMRKSISVLFFCFSLLILLPTFFAPIIRNNDFNGNVLEMVYSRNVLLSSFTIPQWIPYINQGLPAQADPINAFFHPLVFVSFMLFPPDVAVKVIVFISLFLAQVFMYILLKKLKIDTVLSVLLSLTYASSSYFVARIIAGHLEKVLTFPLLPLFFLFLLLVEERKNLLRIGGFAFVFFLMLFSGDIYNLLYAVILLSVSAIYFLIKRDFKMVVSIIEIFALFFLFSAVRIIPFLELQKYVEKTQEPFAGSQNILSIVYYLFLPVKKIFSFVGFIKALDTGFAWWEKTSFIGIIPLLFFVTFLIKFKKIKFQHSLLFMLLLIILLLMAMPGFALNPYHWIIIYVKSLQFFHVPSRIFAFASAIMLIFVGVVCTYLIKNKKTASFRGLIYLALVLNLVSVVIFSEAVLIKKQNAVFDSNYSLLLNKISKSQPNWYVADFISQSSVSQIELLQNRQFNLEDNYGLQLKDNVAASFTKYDFGTSKVYQDILPRYILAENNSTRPIGLNATKVATNKTVSLYEIKNYSTMVNISGSGLGKNNLLSVNYGVDRFTIKLNGDRNRTLTILQSNYPGWSVYVDKNKGEILNNRFLSTRLLSGAHTYEFKFFSKSYLLGLVISIASILLWILLVLKKHTDKR